MSAMSKKRSRANNAFGSRGVAEVGQGRVLGGLVMVKIKARMSLQPRPASVIMQVPPCQHLMTRLQASLITYEAFLALTAIEVC